MDVSFRYYLTLNDLTMSTNIDWHKFLSDWFVWLGWEHLLCSVLRLHESNKERQQMAAQQ